MLGQQTADSQDMEDIVRARKKKVERQKRHKGLGEGDKAPSKNSGGRTGISAIFEVLSTSLRTCSL